MIILILLGSLGLFLYGMKIMSESLQKIAGDGLRRLSAAMSSRRIICVFIGLLVTAIVQSSTATTVMVVSFVNAGMMSLADSMAVIMGANLGTTVTTWLLTLLGFHLDIVWLLFPLIALSLPLFNSRNNLRNSWGEFLIGFSLLFLGLYELRQAFDGLMLAPAFQEVVTASAGFGYGTVALYLLVGIIITFIVQTSSASFILAVLICQLCRLPLECGFAMVIGFNIGTSIIPLFASRSANNLAKKAALGHLAFNLIGSVWAFVLFAYFARFILWSGSIFGFNEGSSAYVALYLAYFHTAFNLINLCLLFPLSGLLVKLISRILPADANDDDSFRLQYINKGFLAASGEMALVQVQKETSSFAEETYRMFLHVKAMTEERLSTDRIQEMLQRAKKMEEENDNAELEIAQFINQLDPQTLSASGEQMCRNLYKVVDELESIADSLLHCAVSIYQKSEQRIRFSAEMNVNIQKMFDLTDQAFLHMNKVLAMDSIPANALNKAYNFEDEINNLRNQLRNEMLDSIDRKAVDYAQNTYMMLLINECEKIGDYVINVIAAASE